MATPGQIRQVAIEVAGNIDTLKTSVDGLKATVDAVQAVTSTWTLDGLDADLPAAVDVKAQVVAYEAINAILSKPGNDLSDSISAVKAAE